LSTLRLLGPGLLGPGLLGPVLLELVLLELVLLGLEVIPCPLLVAADAKVSQARRTTK
jgi:hypothetical protein